MEKKELYIFNPENDLALAFGEEGYTAPPAARQLRRDLQMLPAWYAPCGSTIMSENCGIDAEWLEAMRATFGVDISCMARNHLQNHQFEKNLLCIQKKNLKIYKEETKLKISFALIKILH